MPGVLLAIRRVGDLDDVAGRRPRAPAVLMAPEGGVTVAVTDHAVERFRQRVGTRRGGFDQKPEIAGRVSEAWAAGRVSTTPPPGADEAAARGTLYVRDLVDRGVVFVCRHDRASRELLVITLWEDARYGRPRVDQRFTDVLKETDARSSIPGAAGASAATAERRGPGRARDPAGDRHRPGGRRDRRWRQASSRCRCSSTMLGEVGRSGDDRVARRRRRWRRGRSGGAGVPRACRRTRRVGGTGTPAPVGWPRDAARCVRPGGTRAQSNCTACSTRRGAVAETHDRKRTSRAAGRAASRARGGRHRRWASVGYWYRGNGAIDGPRVGPLADSLAANGLRPSEPGCWRATCHRARAGRERRARIARRCSASLCRPEVGRWSRSSAIVERCRGPPEPAGVRCGRARRQVTSAVDAAFRSTSAAMLDALAAGTPVIASDVKALAEVLRDAQGERVRARRPELRARSSRCPAPALHDEPPLRRRLGRRWPCTASRRCRRDAPPGSPPRVYDERTA